MYLHFYVIFVIFGSLFCYLCCFVWGSTREEGYLVPGQTCIEMPNIKTAQIKMN